MSGYPSYSTPRLYVGNLPWDVTEREVEDLFYKFGRIRDIELKRSHAQDSAFAFILYDDPTSVNYAIERRDGVRYAGGYLRVERGGERRGHRGGGEGFGPPRRSAYRVRVYGLPPTASWQDLKDHMRKAGDVGYANVENGVGIVEYLSRDDMEYAICNLDKSEFCNIFHRAQVRVERDDGDGYEDSYHRRSTRRSRSRSHGRHRSSGRSPDGGRDVGSRRSASRSGSRSRSRSRRSRAASDDATDYRSARKSLGREKDKSLEATRSRSRSRSRSATGSSQRDRRSASPHRGYSVSPKAAEGRRSPPKV